MIWCGGGAPRRWGCADEVQRAIAIEPMREREGKRVEDDAHHHAKLRLRLDAEEERQ